MDLISVIVPVYKVEAYLDRCVQSIVDQTYTNLEIILVDDGSPDNCPAMCDAWAAKDPRIKVIHKENRGVSSARNVGMNIAKGEFVCFVDSDDWIDLQYVSILHSAVETYGADVAVCKMAIFENDSTMPTTYCGEPNMWLGNTMDAMKSLVYGGDYRGCPCDKLYRRELLCGVEFPLGYRHEDEFFAHRVVVRANVVVFVDAYLYGYYQRDNSFMHRFTLGRLDVLEAFWERLEILNQQFPELYPVWCVKYCNTCINLYAEVLKAQPGNFKEYDRKIRMYRKRVRIQLSEFLGLPIARKAYVLGGRVPYLFCSVLNFVREKRHG